MAALKGSVEYKARLRAIGQAFKPIGKQWADTAVALAPPKVPEWPTPPPPTGRLERSIRRKSATMRKAVVAGHYTAYFVDHGVKPHSLSPRVRGEGAKGRGVRTVFSRKQHPGYRARPFRAYIAHESLRRHPMSETVIAEWNKAA